MTPEQALREARERKLRPVYLIVGEDRYRQTMVVRALREAALEGGNAALNEEQLDAADVGVEAVLSAARTVPMLGPRRLIVVRSLERWEPRATAKNASEALDRLAEYAKAPSPTTTLLLVAPKLDKRRRLVSQANSGGWLVGCDFLPAKELPRWVDEQAKALGVVLAPGVSGLLAELCGPELGPVADALERLTLYVGAGGRISEDTVGECVIRVRPSTVWDLVAAVGRRDAGAALTALDSVYDPQDRGLSLLGLLAWSLRRLIRFQSALRGGLSPNEAANASGAPPFQARELARQAKAIPPSTLAHWLRRLARVDLELKGGSRRHPKAVMEAAILELCGPLG
ncbi:MAG TPA: DNA polymerase III subunit delta [Polyangiaceae bacterium]|jgi:DNA polymerase-3 subunit delta